MVPFESQTNLGLSEDAKRVFGQATMDPVVDHKRDTAHIRYSNAVREMLVAEGNLNSMTTDQAKAFLKKVEGSANSDIHSYLQRISTPSTAVRVTSGAATLLRVLTPFGIILDAYNYAVEFERLQEQQRKNCYACPI